MKSRWLPILIVCAGMLPSAWLLLRFRDTPQLGFLMDDVMYVGAAQSLADTGTYRQTVLPGDPWQTKYPPGYPLLLAGILKLHPAARDFWIIAHSWLWMLAACFALAWALTEVGLTRLQAATAACAWGANPSGSLLATSALSEAPFSAALFLATGVVQRAKNNGSLSMALIAGLLLGLASMIRIAGAVAAAGIVVWLVWNRRWKIAAGFAAAAGILPALWMAWSHAHLPPGQDYITLFYFDYGGAWMHILRAAGLRAVLLRNLTFGVMGMGGWMIASYSRTFWAILRDALLTAGGALAFSEWQGGPFWGVALATLGFYAVYCFPSDGRFLSAVAPAFLAACVAALSRRTRLLKGIVIASVAAADLYGTAALAQDYAAKRQRVQALVPAYDFVRSQVPSGAAILGDAHAWLATGRPVVGMPLPMEYFYLDRDNASLDPFFLHYKEVARSFGAAYVMLTPWGIGSELVGEQPHRRFLDAVRSDPELAPVSSSGGIEIFRIRSESPPRDALR